MTEDRCSKMVYSDHGFAGFGGHRCLREGILELNGKRYCKQHFPPNVEAKRAAREAEWRRESAERDMRNAASIQRQSELERKAQAYDRLVKWIDSTGTYIWIRKILDGEKS